MKLKIHAARVLLNGRLLFAKCKPAVDFAVREFILHGNPTFCRLKALIKGSDQEDHTRRRHKEMTFRWTFIDIFPILVTYHIQLKRVEARYNQS